MNISTILAGSLLVVGGLVMAGTGLLLIPLGALYMLFTRKAIFRRL